MKKIVIPFFLSSAAVVAVFLLFNGADSYFEKLLRGNSQNVSLYCLLSFLVFASDVLLPVPSTVVLFVNGLVLGFGAGMVLSLASALGGAALGYVLGKYTASGLKAKEDGKASDYLHRYGGLAIMVSRVIPIVSESVSIVCGYNRMNFKNYLLLNLLGYLPVCTIYVYLGSISANTEMFVYAFGSSIVLAVLFFVFGRRFLQSQAVNE